MIPIKTKREIRKILLARRPELIKKLQARFQEAMLKHKGNDHSN